MANPNRVHSHKRNDTIKKYEELDITRRSGAKGKPMIFILFNNKHYSVKELTQLEGCEVPFLVLKQRILRLRNEEGAFLTLKEAIFTKYNKCPCKERRTEARKANLYKIFTINEISSETRELINVFTIMRGNNDEHNSKSNRTFIL